MTSFESTQSSGVEVDGIRFETLVPDREWLIPENQPGANTPVQLGLRITNNTQTAIRFTRFDTLVPELVKPDGQTLQRDGGRNWTSMPTISDCPLVQPRETVNFFLDAKLTWRNNKLQLGGSDGFGGIWFMDNLKPGMYQTRIWYSSWTPGPMGMYEPKTQTLIPIENLWKGSAATPFVEVRLVQH